MAHLKKKQPKRDPNVPVLAWLDEANKTEYEILIAGPGEHITCAHNPKYQWSDNSLIYRCWSHGSLKEIEHYLYDPVTWGWIGRLLSARPDVRLRTKTDLELIKEANGAIESVGRRTSADSEASA